MAVDISNVPQTISAASKLYEKAAAALKEAWQSQAPVPRAETLQWASALELILSIYASPKNWPNASTPREPLPPGIATILLQQIRYLKAGSLEEPWRFLVRRGAPKIGPHYEQSLAVAVAYIKAARKGLIDDETPIATVANCFRVWERTVKRWLQKYPHVEPSNLFHGAQEKELGPKLAKALEKEATRYPKLSRNQSSIRARDSKRRKPVT